MLIFLQDSTKAGKAAFSPIKNSVAEFIFRLIDVYHGLVSETDHTVGNKGLGFEKAPVRLSQWRKALTHWSKEFMEPLPPINM